MRAKQKHLLIIASLCHLITSCSKDIGQIIGNSEKNNHANIENQGLLIVGGDSIYYKQTNGRYYLGEDFYLSQQQFNKLLASKDSTRNARGLTIGDMGLRWPNSTIPYTISATFVEPTRIQTAINLINTQTHIKLVPRNGQGDYVEFVSIAGSTSYSALGKAGNKQRIEISDGANYGTIIHEIFHAAGIMHEHQRSDINQYLEINFSNIKPDWQDQYKTRSGTIIGGFNRYSIMNYGSFANSTVAYDSSIPVMRYKTPNGGLSTYSANRDSITSTDKLSLHYLYGPRDFRYFRRTNTTTINEAYVDNATDIYDTTAEHTITFHNINPPTASTAITPLKNFMKVRVQYLIQKYGSGPLNLVTERTQEDILCYPGQSSFSLTTRARQNTYLGYYQPDTYMESIERIDVIN
ncbi:M12 family metallopeptidase [Sphingobacterium thalpophilum]|uniref:Flavastacin n=1 Tax=Sphingobacterium thalpophilum TaxID=259 RepID=A0A4U9U7I5_9SPHI|nr:M12 family metallopeptidase [Sphingobacterium thalpophilum]VTR29015.1 Flavastacin precursor [Sphingobacterium thalpophilum]